MKKTLCAVEVEGIEQFHNAINKPPKGYELHSWGLVYAPNNVYYTIVYTKLSPPADAQESK